MLKTLMKKQVCELGAFLFQSGKNGKQRSKGSRLLYAVLWIYVIGIMGWLFFQMADVLCQPLAEAGMGWLYFSLVGTMATALGVIGSVFTTYSGLYQAKDNDLLFSMPIPPSQILLVRLVSIYVMSFVFEAVALVPSICVYHMYMGVSPAALVLGILAVFILPLLALAISCVLGWIMGVFSAYTRGRGKNIINVVLAIGFIAAYYYIYSQAYRYLQLIIINSEKIGAVMRGPLYLMYQMGMALAEGDILAFAVFTLIIAAVFGIVYFVLSRSFLTLSTSKKGEVKVKYKEKRMRASSADSALLRKERMRFTGSSVYMLNCGLGTIFLLAASVFVIIKGSWLRDMLGVLYQGAESVVPLLLCAVICVISTMNNLSAPSVSLEGKSIWIVRSMPVSTWQILRAKLKLHIIVTAVPTLFCAVCASVMFRPGIYYSVMIPVVSVIFVVFSAALGLTANLKMPNLNWSNETVAVKQGMSVMVALFGGWAVLFSLGGVYFALSDVLSGEVYLLLCGLVLGAAAAALVIRLKNKGTRIFETL